SLGDSANGANQTVINQAVTNPTVTNQSVTNQAETNKIEVRNFSFYYGSVRALSDLTLPIREKKITALIGPSGCGKSTFLRSLNRMNDTIPGARAEGEVLLDGKS